MVSREDNELFNCVQLLARHGGDKSNFDFVLPGINSRLDALQAAFLVEKFKVYPSVLKRKRAVADFYMQELKDVSNIKLQSISPSATHGWHQFVIRVPQPEDLCRHFSLDGVEVKRCYKRTLPEQACFGGDPKMASLNYPNSYSDTRSVVSLPLHANMDLKQAEVVVRSLKEFYE